MCACAHASYIVILQPLLMSTLCVSFFKLLITFSISMYIICVILCFFSALSCRVGALQVSIIIIINKLARPAINKSMLNISATSVSTKFSLSQHPGQLLRSKLAPLVLETTAGDYCPSATTPPHPPPSFRTPQHPHSRQKNKSVQQ